MTKRIGLVIGTHSLAGFSADMSNALETDTDVRTSNVFGDGQATRRCADAIAHFFGHGERPADFQPSTTSGLAKLP